MKVLIKIRRGIGDKRDTRTKMMKFNFWIKIKN